MNDTQIEALLTLVSSVLYVHTSTAFIRYVENGKPLFYEAEHDRFYSMIMQKSGLESFDSVDEEEETINEADRN